jgi:hypothetical protein
MKNREEILNSVRVKIISKIGEMLYQYPIFDLHEISEITEIINKQLRSEFFDVLKRDRQIKSRNREQENNG